jgi:hypothetical protein
LATRVRGRKGASEGNSAGVRNNRLEFVNIQIDARWPSAEVECIDWQEIAPYIRSTIKCPKLWMLRINARVSNSDERPTARERPAALHVKGR